MTVADAEIADDEHEVARVLRDGPAAARFPLRRKGIDYAVSPLWRLVLKDVNTDESAAIDDRLQILAIDETHRDEQAPVDLAEVVDRYHVRIIQSCSGFRLSPEPSLVRVIVGETDRQHLDRHHALGHRVEGTPHFPHAAAAQLVNEPVAAERRPSTNEPPRRRLA
jgi:hypothetical protein